MSDVITARNRHNILVRHHGPDDPRTLNAAAELRAVKIAAIIEQPPPLTDAQLGRIRALLTPALDNKAAS